jgi:alkanesulfonate monooxygenase SsuD/methylene tetrahydromethanopterin reductase-like flavin-dependent oxidoreductase (luciferase family)
MTRFAYMPDTHFGVYDEPHPDRDAVHAGNEQCVLEAETAENAGFDAIWIPERHARTETYAPSPIVILAAIAARTKSIRIAPTVLQPTFYNPMMVAEQYAQLDQLSKGRLIFGAGVGYNADHFRLLGVPKKHTGRRFEECMEVIDRAWREERFSFDGEFFQYDDVRLTPKPYQQPRPPIWIGAFYDKAIERALNWDGWCWWFPLELDESQAKIEHWRERAEEKRGANNWTVALAYEGWVGKDGQAVRERHGPRWEREARFYVERGMSPDMGVDPLGSLERRYLLLGNPAYWIERLGEIIDRLNPDWICLRTRTPAVESGPAYPSLQESLENIHMLGEQVIRYFQR